MPSRTDFPSRPGDFLTDIASKSYKLNPININEELEKRERERKKGTKEGVMEEIRAQTGIDLKLLDQGTSEGRKYWISNPDRYIEELKKAFQLDHQAIKIIWDLMESTDTVLFKDKYSTLRNRDLTQKEFADVLHAIGFTIKSQRFLVGTETEPTTEYTHILQPHDLPYAVMTKTILSSIHGVPEEYAKEPELEVVTETLTFKPRK